MRKLAILSMAFVAFTAMAQTEVSQYTPGVTSEGITYFLPRTELKVTVLATKKVYKPGDFYKYAARYLRLENVVKEEQTEWSIDQVQIEPYGVPDKTKIYTIKLNKKTAAPLVGLTKDGILVSINTEAPEEPQSQGLAVKQDAQKKLNPRDYMTEEILAAGSTSKMAELTAGEIYDIRENRGLLSKGQADFMPKDGEQLKIMIKELDTQEEALLQLFKGTSESESKLFTIHYDPSKEETDILFRFSRRLGLVDKDDLAGDPVYIRIKDQQNVPAPVSADGKKKKEEENVRYNVPGKVEVAIFDNARRYAEGVYPMGQFGNVEFLGGDLFNKKYTTRVTFYPTTGGIRKLDADNPQ